MLSRKEKQEIHNDGRNVSRRREFAAAPDPSLNIETQEDLYQRSLDEFIQYLKTIQRIFSPIISSQKITTTRFNKL